MKRLLSIIFAIICIFSFALLCFAHSGRTDANGGHFDHSTGEYHYHNSNSINETITETCGYDYEYYKEKAKKKDEEEYQKLVEDYEKRQELLDNTTTENSGIDWEYHRQKAIEKGEEEYQKLVEDNKKRQELFNNSTNDSDETTSYKSFAEYTNEKYANRESDIWTVQEEYQQMVEDYKTQELTDNATSLIISLFVTLLAYGAFPFIFAKTKKTPITKKKYKRLCYGINIVVLFIFAIINGTFNIAPYILWTWVFSKYGMKVLGTKGLMPDSVYLE